MRTQPPTRSVINNRGLGPRAQALGLWALGPRPSVRDPAALNDERSTEGQEKHGMSRETPNDKRSTGGEHTPQQEV